MKDEQLYLFPEMETITQQIINKECVDISETQMDFTGNGNVFENANRMVKKLKSIPKDIYYCFRKGQDGLPYVKNTKTGNILKRNDNRNQYPCWNIGGVTIACHRLIALTYLKNDDTLTKVEVDHIDQDKFNYTPENLRWVSTSQNIKFSKNKK